MRDDLDSTAPHPRALLPIANEGYGFLFVDLSSDHNIRPGAVYEWWIDGGEYKMIALDIADVFHACSDMIEVGEGYDDGGNWWLENYEPYFEARLRMAGATDEQTRPIVYEPLQWPQRWRDINGFTDEKMRPRGATHTVAEFIAARQHGAVTGTIIAGRSSGGIGSVIGSRGFIRDETGELELTIPSTVIQYGEKESGLFEYDITATQWTAPEHSIRELDNALAEVQRLAL